MRQYLTNHKKLSIQKEIQRRRNHTEPYNLGSLASSAKKEFKLSCNPFNAVLSRIITGTVTIPDNHEKRSSTVVQPDIEAKLAVWSHDQNNAGRYVTGAIIREQGKLILEDVNMLLPSTQK